MKKITLSIPVLGIRLITGKTFGFARLADRGGDAFVSPPLMREVEGKIPPHAIVEMAEKGRRVIRFLAEPETKLVWEGKPDEERMIALAPEIARRWADYGETHPGEICGVSDYGHAEFSALWFAACAAGESGKFIARWEKENFTPARKREVESRISRLFATWESELIPYVEKHRAKVIGDAREGRSYYDTAERYLPWWHKYAPEEIRSRTGLTAGSLFNETKRLVEEVSAAKKVADDARRAKAQTEEEMLWQKIISGVKNPGVVLLPRSGESCDYPIIKVGDKTHLASGCGWDQRARDLSNWLKSLGLRREALQVSSKNWYHWEPFSEAEIDEIIAAEDERAKWFSLFTLAEKANLVSYYGSHIGGSGHCEVAGTQVSESFFRARTDDEGLWPEEREKYAAWGVETRVIGWDRNGSPTCTSAELERLIAVADMDAVKRDLRRHEPITEPAKMEKVHLLAEQARLKEEAKAEELRQRGLREEETRLATRNAAEEKKLRDIASVRKDWARMLRWVSASGAYRGLHPDAQALLERVRSAQEKARELRPANEHRRIEAEAGRKETEKSGFLSKGTWGALDGLKL